MKETGKVSVCGLCAKREVEIADDGNLIFDAGYFIRLIGDVLEISMEDLQTPNDLSFAYCLADQQRYPVMTTFIVYRAEGEIFDYDFEKCSQDHK